MSRRVKSPRRPRTVDSGSEDDDDVEGLDEFEDLYKADDDVSEVQAVQEEERREAVDLSKITSSAERNMYSAAPCSTMWRVFQSEPST